MAIRRSVLIVEEDKSIQQSLKALLGRDGYEAMIASNIREAMEYLKVREAEPAAILMCDKSSPSLGRDFLEKLETEFPPLFASLPVYILAPRF